MPHPGLRQLGETHHGLGDQPERANAPHDSRAPSSASACEAADSLNAFSAAGATPDGARQGTGEAVVAIGLREARSLLMCDFDGTLFDSMPPKAEAMYRAFVERDPGLAGRRAESVKCFMDNGGRSTAEMIEATARLLGVRLSDVESDRLRDRYWELEKPLVKAQAGTRTCVGWSPRRTWAMCSASWVASRRSANSGAGRSPRAAPTCGSSPGG
jgi:hypothetical protein